jgi:hypothetical protein
MPNYEDLGKFEAVSGTSSNISGDGTTAADTDLVVIEVDHMSVVTNLRVTGATSEVYDLVVRDQGGANSEVRKTLVGSDLDDGDFEEPAVRNIGAGREIAVINRTQLDDDNYGINLLVHELKRDTIA